MAALSGAGTSSSIRAIGSPSKHEAKLAEQVSAMNLQILSNMR